MSSLCRHFLPQILRWTGNNATTSIFFPGYNLWTESTGCRFLSSNDQTASVSAQHNQNVCRAKLELSVSSLVEMGFTDAQAKHLYDSVSSVRGGKAGQVLPTLTALFVLGLNPSRVSFVLDKCPELYTVNETQLQQRIDLLRKLGLVEGEVFFRLEDNTLLVRSKRVSQTRAFSYEIIGSLQRMVVHYPKILTVPVKSVKNAVNFLRVKCLFTTQQITEILRDSPAVVLEDQDHLEYKFQVSKRSD